MRSVWFFVVWALVTGGIWDVVRQHAQIRESTRQIETLRKDLGRVRQRISSIHTAAAAKTAIPVDDLFAEPERYVDQDVIIEAHLRGVDFLYPVSGMVVGSTKSTRILFCFFTNQTLDPESRLFLVHAAKGTLLRIQGRFVTITQGLRSVNSLQPGSGDQLDVIEVLPAEGMDGE